MIFVLSSTDRDAKDAVVEYLRQYATGSSTIVLSPKQLEAFTNPNRVSRIYDKRDIG